MVEKMGNGYVKIGVKQEDLEDSIHGLQQLKPILQMQVIKGNGSNTHQAAKDATAGVKDMRKNIESLIRALERFDSLKTVIAELRAYDNDREVTIEAIAEYLEDEADYANE